MATMQERAELHKTIWKIANDLRGKHQGLAPVSGRNMMADVRWLMSARKAI